MKSEKQKTKTEIVIACITEVEQYILLAYLLCMFGIFPLYFKEKYYGIGDAKFEFFWKASLLFVATSAFFLFIRMIVQNVALGNKFSGRNKVDIKKECLCDMNDRGFLKFLDQLSFMDYTVFIYGICVCLSYAFSDYKEYALKGAVGWEMGLCSQLIFIAIYFIIARKKEIFSGEEIYLDEKLILGVHIFASTCVFVFGILHRFDIDPLGMYEGLNLNQKVEFLSTIGQATWFSSYVCTTFAIGLALFYISKKKWVCFIGAVYTVISFAILVTQNSDSAFIAIAGIMLLLGYFSFIKIEQWIRFLEIQSLMWGTFAVVGILQKVFQDRAIPLDTLSVFFSQGIVTWVMLAFSILMLLFYFRVYKKEKIANDFGENKNQCEKTMYLTKRIYQGILIAVVIGIFATLIFIYLNTKGYLLRWFDYQNTHQYLLFDYHWGSNRGSTWIITWQAFWQMPLHQKLFGVGPDSLSEYLYSMQNIHDFLRSLWGNMRLTNAHNEYLNSLACYGIIGATAWMSVLIGGIVYFYKKAKENSMMIAFVLCIVGYACHNIFCYQQVCCTPFLFILLGIGESLTKSENFNTIK